MISIVYSDEDPISIKMGIDVLIPSKDGYSGTLPFVINHYLHEADKHRHLIHRIIVDTTIGRTRSRHKLLNNSAAVFVLFNDDDKTIPGWVLHRQREILSADESVGCCALSLDGPRMDHPSIGVSMWRRLQALVLYSYPEGANKCECVWNWNRIKENRLRLHEIKDVKAKHYNRLRVERERSLSE